MYYVYVLKSQVDGRLYKGFTNNLERRIKEHNSGKHKSTKAFKPWILVYNEIAEGREKARKREVYLKSGLGREFLKRKLEL
ncbi:MAG: GIY-YIG nuclease family protein [Bacteroidetes bacterium]|nr:GIY-YIG nuclease family protein [Bacteroidota bacterium]MCB2222435.1 GIY-YIG nuclease family protein [Bacteroidota bacterium]